MTSPTTYKLGFPKLKYATVPMASGAPFTRDPTSSDLYDPKVGGFYQIGTLWPNKTTKGIWMLASITSGTTANWVGISDAASGDVVGPVSATDNALARFDGITGKVIQNGIGILSDAGVLTGLTAIGIGIAPTAYLGLKAGTATAGTAPLKFALGVNLGTPESGAIEYDGTKLYYTDGSATRNTIAKAPSTTPSSAPTKGSFTFDGSGTHTKILTTACVTGSIVVYTYITLGTVTKAQAVLTTIDTGVGFTPVSADATDSSVVNWAIVG